MRRLVFIFIILFGFSCKSDSSFIECSCQFDVGITLDDTTGIWLPTAFTPNKDGLNDSYWIYSSNVTQIQITISKNSVVVFSSSDPKSSWNGEKDKILQPAGNYDIEVKGLFTQNRPFNLKTQICLFLNCGSIHCTYADQITNRGYNGLVSSDPMAVTNCK